jgi:hypothetical protein
LKEEGTSGTPSKEDKALKRSYASKKQVAKKISKGGGMKSSKEESEDSPESPEQPLLKRRRRLVKKSEVLTSSPSKGTGLDDDIEVFDSLHSLHAFEANCEASLGKDVRGPI